MDLQPVPGDDDLLDHQPQDGLLDLETGVLELAAELLLEVLGEVLRTGDLTHGKRLFRLPGAKFGLLVFDRENPLLD